MGCTNSSEDEFGFKNLISENIALMDQNLKLLRIFGVYFDQLEKYCARDEVYKLAESLENFYSLINRYRRLYISNILNQNPKNSESIEDCKKEILKEKAQLNSTHDVLMMRLEHLSHLNISRFSSISEMIEHFETISSSNQTPDKVSIQNEDVLILNSLQAVTVKQYIIPEKRIYYTTEIISMNPSIQREEKRLLSNVRI